MHGGEIRLDSTLCLTLRKATAINWQKYSRHQPSMKWIKELTSSCHQIISVCLLVTMHLRRLPHRFRFDGLFVWGEEITSTIINVRSGSERALSVNQFRLKENFLRMFIRTLRVLHFACNDCELMKLVVIFVYCEMDNNKKFFAKLEDTNVLWPTSRD
jgi:hypothetical protein